VPLAKILLLLLFEAGVFAKRVYVLTNLLHVFAYDSVSIFETSPGAEFA